MIVKVRSTVLDNQRLKIREISNELGLSFGLVQSILSEDLGKKCILTKSIQKLPTVQQKETCLAVARELLQCTEEDTNFIKTIITSDEFWVCGYDLETKAQTSQWKSPGP
jgi:DNA-binding Lrp family transcriptional regulator